MSSARVVYAGLLVVAAFWAVMSAIFLLGSPYEDDRFWAWFWASSFVAASLATAWCFWQLLGESA